MKKLVIGLLIIAAILILTFTALAQSSTPSDPFLSYADLLVKNQVLDAMKDWDFECNIVLSVGYHNCTVAPEDGLFSNIQLVIIQGVPQYISFKIETDTLKIGDLLTLWGRPDEVLFYTSTMLLWQERNGLTKSALSPSSADAIDYLAPVWAVSFTF